MHKVREAGLESEIAADSAGTGDWHAGSAPHPGTAAVLRSEHIDYRHAARTLTPDDFSRFDLICSMDESNFANVEALSKRSANTGHSVIRRFMEFAPHTGVSEVPDPYYDGNFRQTFDLVSAASDGLLDFIKAKYRLR